LNCGGNDPRSSRVIFHRHSLYSNSPGRPINSHMADKRIEPRLMCADLVDVEWRDCNGRSQHIVANLEDISALGACIQVECEIPLRTTIRMTVLKVEYVGEVRYCVFREYGYFLGIQFEPGVKWSSRAFKPLHLFDPRRLLDARPLK